MKSEFLSILSWGLSFLAGELQVSWLVSSWLVSCNPQFLKGGGGEGGVQIKDHSSICNQNFCARQRARRAPHSPQFL
jgi:hypothetical protein